MGCAAARPVAVAPGSLRRQAAGQGRDLHAGASDGVDRDAQALGARAFAEAFEDAEVGDGGARGAQARAAQRGKRELGSLHAARNSPNPAAQALGAHPEHRGQLLGRLALSARGLHQGPIGGGQPLGKLREPRLEAQAGGWRGTGWGGPMPGCGGVVREFIV